MNIVVVNDTLGVEVYKKWSDVKKYTSYTKDDFAQVGKDYILNVDAETYEIAKDIKMLERVASERVFQKSKFEITDWLTVLSFLFVVLIYFKM